MFNIDPKEEFFRNQNTWIYCYHLAKLMTRIDEIKFIENITVDQRHDLITRRLAGGWDWRDSVDDDNELLIFEFSNDVGRRSFETFWSSANKKKMNDAIFFYKF